MFDPNKPYTARNGSKVTILRVRRNGSFIVIREIDEMILFCDRNGKYFDNFPDEDGEYDLINIPESYITTPDLTYLQEVYLKWKDANLHVECAIDFAFDEIMGALKKVFDET